TRRRGWTRQVDGRVVRQATRYTGRYSSDLRQANDLQSLVGDNGCILVTTVLRVVRPLKTADKVVAGRYVRRYRHESILDGELIRVDEAQRDRADKGARSDVVRGPCQVDERVSLPRRCEAGVECVELELEAAAYQRRCGQEILCGTTPNVLND